MTDLKPCPGCGCEPDVMNILDSFNGNNMFWTIGCISPSCRDPKFTENYSTEEGARLAWNNDAVDSVEVVRETFNNPVDMNGETWDG